MNMYTKFLLGVLYLVTVWEMPPVRRFILRRLENMDKKILNVALSNDKGTEHEESDASPYDDGSSDERSRLRQ